MKKNSLNTTAIKKILPYGAIKELATRSETTPYTASRVINGYSKNPVVLRNLKRMIEEIKTTNSEINALASETQIAC